MSTNTYVNSDNGHLFRIDELPCPSFLKEYLTYQLTMRNLSQKTVIEYYKKIDEFLRWTQCRATPKISKKTLEGIDISKLSFTVVEEIGQGDILEYITFCTAILDNATATRAAKLAALRSFFEYYSYQAKRLETNPMAGVKQPKKEKPLPKYLSKTECMKLLYTAKTQPVSQMPDRDYCMLVFFLNCGMRISELVGINVSDIRENQLKITGKGRKDREVYLNKACMDALKDCLVERSLVKESDRQKALFISNRTGERLTDVRVRQIMDKLFFAAGFEGRGYSPHKLRHSAATLWMNDGVDLVQIQEILGHESIATTQVYLHVSAESIRDTMEHSALSEFDPGSDTEKYSEL